MVQFHFSWKRCLVGKISLLTRDCFEDLQNFVAIGFAKGRRNKEANPGWEMYERGIKINKK